MPHLLLTKEIYGNPKDLKKQNAELERKIETLRMENASLKASFLGRLGRQLREVQIKMAENDSKSV